MIKYSSPLSIQYFFVSDDVSFTDSEYYISSFNLIRQLPIDLMQLNNAVNHYEFFSTYKPTKGYEIFSIPGTVFQSDTNENKIRILEYSQYFNITSLIKLFFIDGKISNFETVIKSLQDELFFVCIVNPPINVSYIENVFDSVEQFLSLMNSKIDTIKSKLALHYVEDKENNISTELEFRINPNKAYIEQNELSGSMVEFNNYYVLNQIIGDFWLRDGKDFEPVLSPPQDRIIKVVEKAKKIDRFVEILYDQVGLVRTDIFQPYYSSLILIAPYHYPKFEKLYSLTPTTQQKKWLAILNSEQDLNYQHQISTNDDELSPQIMASIMKRNLLRINFIDIAGYLHAMFSYSPVVRLPQIGKSINKELSHLEKTSAKRSSTINNIKKFGKRLANLTISGNLADYILNRNGQIFAISDLPVEWLHLNDFPLALTHDVCRLPEFNLNSLINNAIHLQRRLYEIPPDLIRKTLVIHCASKTDTILNEMFDVIDSYKDNLGFNSVKCSNVAEVVNSISAYKPELLIFDCHGSSDAKDFSSFLILDKDRKIVLTGDDIVKHKISAPLVFLSACETFPNYGYVRLLSDAFMEAGAYCVTTTFLPIKISDATSLLVRLLNNLHQLSSKTHHLNWLHFISHMLRSTFIFETIRRSKMKFNFEISDDEMAEILTKFMHFESRVNTLNELNKLIKEKSKREISFNDLDNEWLSYSTIGRADLIYFESWLKDYRDLNVGNRFI